MSALRYLEVSAPNFEFDFGYNSNAKKDRPL